MEQNIIIADTVTKYSRNEKLIKNHYLYPIEQPTINGLVSYY